MKAGIDAQRPKAMETIDKVDRALKDGFTVAVVQVYRLAFFLAVLAFVLTLMLPQLPLRGRPTGPPVAE